MKATTPLTDMKSLPKMHPPIRVDALDGIRALAALWVMCQHGLNFIIPIQWHQGWRGLFTAWLGNAHFAVALFIVLSGFCLAIPVARHGALREGAVTFFMLPFWSVCAEWKIYFLFPLLVGVLLRFGPGLMLALGAVVSLLLTEIFLLVGHGMPLIYTCPWYLFLFCLGIAAGHQVYGQPRHRLGKTFTLLTGYVSLSVLVITITQQQPGNLFLMSQDVTAGIAAAALLTALASNLTRSRTHDGLLGFLSWRPLVRLGTMSYSLYLIHVPLLRTLFCATGQIVPHSDHWSWKHHFAWHLLVLFPLVIGLTYLFHLVAERPFIGGRRKETPAEVARDAALSPAP